MVLQNACLPLASRQAHQALRVKFIDALTPGLFLLAPTGLKPMMYKLRTKAK
jgi:hypothetical protein